MTKSIKLYQSQFFVVVTSTRVAQTKRSKHIQFCSFVAFVQIFWERMFQARQESRCVTPSPPRKFQQGNQHNFGYQAIRETD